MGATEFRSLSVSIGAFPFGSLRSNGALWRVFICLLFLDPVFSVTCFTCKDSIAGCPGGDQCPLVTDLADNVELFCTGSLSEGGAKARADKILERIHVSPSATIWIR